MRKLVPVHRIPGNAVLENWEATSCEISGVHACMHTRLTCLLNLLHIGDTVQDHRVEGANRLLSVPSVYLSSFSYCTAVEDISDTVHPDTALPNGPPKTHQRRRATWYMTHRCTATSAVLLLLREMRQIGETGLSIM